VRVIEIESGAVTTLQLPVTEEHTVFGGLSWANTQEVLAFTESVRKTMAKPKKGQTTYISTSVHLIELESGETSRLTGGGRPAWSPDDTHLVWTGITRCEIATGLEVSLGSGSYPDWKR
jgi:hypothetical protein